MPPPEPPEPDPQFNPVELKKPPVPNWAQPTAAPESAKDEVVRFGKVDVAVVVAVKY